MSRSSWVEATSDNSCSICGKPDWCSVSADGTWAICRRKDDGTGIHKVDSSGANYWVYKVPGAGNESINVTEKPPPEAKVPEKAAPEMLDRVYSSLLDGLDLTEAHKQDLLRRDLSKEDIERGGYRSLPKENREGLASRLVEEFGIEVCSGVPGLYRRGGDASTWSVAGVPGLLVPVRDTAGRVVALKVRADEPGAGPKYSYVSSTSYGGPGPGAQVHVPISKGPNPGAVRITEGELKADVATTLTGIQTISVPGVSSWRPVLPVLEELGHPEVYLAFDADARENPNVARPLSAAFKELEERGYEVAVETWPPEHGKGIDDLLAARHEPELKRGAEARKAVNLTVAHANGLHVALSKIVTGRELLAKEFPEPKWIIPKTLPEGATILAGKPKTGKSWLAFDTALAVSTGGVVLGDIEVERGEVLYLALEDLERRLQGRLKTLLSGKVDPGDLELVTEWPLLDEGGYEALECWLEIRPNARLIVVDTLAKVRKRGTGKNVYAEDYEAVEPLLKLASDYGIAVLIVHHLRKAAADDPLDEISGSTGLTGGVDGILHLKKGRGRADGYLYVTGRDIEEERELALSWDSVAARWKLLGDADEYRLSKERQEIIDCLRSLGEPAGPKDVSDALGKTSNNVKQLMYKMSNDGDIRSIGGGKYVPVTDNPGNHDNREELPAAEETSQKETAQSTAESEDRDHDGTPGPEGCPGPAVTGVIEVTDLGGYRQHTFISSRGQLEGAVTELRDKEAVGVDLETTGLNPRTDQTRLISLSTEDQTWLVDCFAVDPSPLFPVLATKRLYFHNAIFDLGFLCPMGFELGEKCQVIDTMLMSRMLENHENPEEKEAA